MDNENKSQPKKAGFPSDNHNGIGFLFKKIKVAPRALSYWVTVPEFVDEINKLQNNSETIDEVAVFQIMQGIYKQKEADKAAGIQIDFKFQPARQCIRALSEVLTGDKDAWEVDEQEHVLTHSNGFGFLYKKISLPNVVINNLLKTSEFVSELERCSANNQTIDDEAVSNIIKKLYKSTKEKRYDELFKQKFIKDKGIESWDAFKEKYHIIANAYRYVK